MELDVRLIAKPLIVKGFINIFSTNNYIYAFDILEHKMITILWHNSAVNKAYAGRHSIVDVMSSHASGD